MRILFYDNVAPSEYTKFTAKSQPLGGTESTVLKIAHALAERKHVVAIANAKTEITKIIDDVIYCRIEPKLFKEKWDKIIVLRNPEAACSILRPLYPATPMFVWCHDLPGPWLTSNTKGLFDKKVHLIAVSDWHKTQLQETMRGLGYGMPRVVRVYNPINDALKPSDKPVNKNNLVFMSSPHKGLEKTLYYFDRLRTFNPDFKLFVFNPNYLPITGISQSGVVYLGGRPQEEVLEFVSSSLCLFYPNTTFAETFGLVLAESLAVGCPVITHDMGAAREVTGGPPFVTDCNDIERVIDRVLEWHRHRPAVTVNSQFRLTQVVNDWLKVLSDEAFNP